MANEGAKAATSDRRPAEGRRTPRGTPKGRQVEPAALAAVRALLGTAPRRRDLLIEHLHRINDAEGRLSLRMLAALAAEMSLSYAEVYEVATFYAHFEIAGDDAPPALPVLRICDGVACMIAGAEAKLAHARRALDGLAKVEPAPCIGACDHAPAVANGFRRLAGEPTVVSPAQLRADAPAATPPVEPAGAGAQWQGCRRGERTPEQVFAVLDESGLRGLGGAGFPTGRKWRLVAEQPGPRLMAVNADEGEPGTFKDRWFLEAEPHRVLEGALIAAWATGCEAIYFYVRDEYPEAREILAATVEAWRRDGRLGDIRVELRRGAGAYVCGEESAMLESLEGKRGLPRHKPPFPAQRGLFGRPTLINNVETLWWIPALLAKGGAWFASQGRRGGKGLRAFSLSGRVARPGVKIAPAGITVRELVDEHGGGMLPGHRFKAYLPGGASGGILPAAMGDLPLDFGKLEPHGCFVGSGAVVVFSDRDDLRAIARNLVRFFEHESCGQCTPCRVGTEKAGGLIAGQTWDAPLLGELAKAMADASICGLGQAAMNPVLSLMRHFPEELS
ncbi:MAG: NAD(P)H-dependent oxidoreductase subunit E [Alphaproteobacteria bacterium]|nr:NAD(P)H-dependent oxidoreductase subunit E [Alphaproteobacteria bacterium]